jgi:IclR family acetate operon transcriptional repressor
MGRTTPVAAVSVTALKDRMPPARMEEIGLGLCRSVSEHV